MTDQGAGEQDRDVLTRPSQLDERGGTWGVLRTRIPMPFSVRGMLRRKSRPGWREVIIGAGLPRGVALRAAEVIRRAGLWPSEKREVARELCAHFADGLHAGKTGEELLAAFGDARPAAKLIGRAARRKRPLWWKTWRMGVRGALVGIALCVGVYGVAFAMAMLGTPRVTRAYAAEMNAALTKAPEEERAWPLYAGIRKDLGLIPEELLRAPLGPDGVPLAGEAGQDMWPQNRGQKRWPLAAAWVDERQEVIERLRKAAVMPTLGCPLYRYMGEGLAWEHMQTEQGSDLSKAAEVDGTTPLVSVLLPFCADSRYLARILLVDSRRAMALKDQERFTKDVEAMVGLAMQAGENGTLIAQLVRLAILAQACDVIREGLAEDFLDERALRRIAHRLGSTGDAGVRIVFDVERTFLMDVVQRTYTDNGSGGGYLTYEGMRQVAAMADMGVQQNGDPAERQRERELQLKVMSPVAVLTDAGRAETVAAAEAMYARAQAEADTPYWRRGDGSTDLEVEQLYGRGTSISPKYAVLRLLMPALGRAGQAGEQMRGVRDGTLVAVALEAYRRAHGVYPTTLDALVPDLLPAAPLDRYDGRALKYVLVGAGTDARPVVYSVGTDRTDDGGRGPAKATGEYAMYQYRGPATVKAWMSNPQMRASLQGDWILYNPAKLERRVSDATRTGAAPATSNR